MMVYPEEPSIWAIPHIPALYDDDGDYGGKHTQKTLLDLTLCPSTRDSNLAVSATLSLHSNLASP